MPALDFLGGVSSGFGVGLSKLMDQRRQERQLAEERKSREQTTVLDILGRALPTAEDPNAVLGAMGRLIAGSFQDLHGKGGGKGKGKGKGPLAVLGDGDSMASLLQGLHRGLTGGAGTPGRTVPIEPPAGVSAAKPVGSGQTPAAPAQTPADTSPFAGIHLLNPAERERQKQDITREEAVQRTAQEAKIKEGEAAYAAAHPKPGTEAAAYQAAVDAFTQQHGRAPNKDETRQIALKNHQDWAAAARKPEPVLGAGAEDERTKEVLARKGIDWQKATPAQITQARQQAANELQAVERQKLQNERLAAQAKAQNLGVNNGLSPSGHELPDVQLGPGGRPDPGQQAAYLKQFPPELARTIKALAEYRQSPTSISSRTTGGLNRQRVLSYVQGYDPTYSDAKYQIRASTLADWSHGKTRDQMTAANRVVRHLGELYTALQTLKAHETEGAFADTRNKLMIKGEIASGNADVRKAYADYETARQAVAGELRKVYAGSSGGSLAEIKQWEDTLDPYEAPTTQIGKLQTAVNLMIGVVASAEDKFHAVMGKNPPPGLALTPAAVRQLSKMGFDLGDLQETDAAQATSSDQGTETPHEGEQKPIPGHPGWTAEYRGGKWIRIK